MRCGIVRGNPIEAQRANHSVWFASAARHAIVAFSALGRGARVAPPERHSRTQRLSLPTPTFRTKMATLQVNALFKKAAPAPKKAAPAKKGFGAPKKAAPAPKKTVKKVAPKKVAPKKTIKKAAPVKKSGNLAQAGDDLTKWYGEYPLHPSAPRRATSVRASSPIPRSRCPAILLPPRTPPCLSRRVARARDPDARDAIPPRAGCSSTSPLPTRRDRAPALRIRAAARDRPPSPGG